MVLAACIVLACMVGTASAALGPDNVFVIAAGDVQDSVDLAKSYMGLRQIPSNRLCAITGIGAPPYPSACGNPKKVCDALTFAQYKDTFFPQVEACVNNSGAADDLVAFVLMRGLPRRVYGATPSKTTSSRLSLAAMLSLWRSACVGGGGTLNNCDNATAGAPMYAQRNYKPIPTWPYAYQRWLSPFYYDKSLQQLPGPIERLAVMRVQQR